VVVLLEAALDRKVAGLRFASDTVIGLTLGGTFALAALSLVLVFRVTGVLNFANGAMGMISTFVAYQFAIVWARSIWLSIAVALLFSLGLGLLLEVAIFRWLTGRSQLVKAVVTIGILLALQAIATLIWGNTQYHLPITFPWSTKVFFIAQVPVSGGHITVIVTAIVLAAGLAALLRYTRLGVAMRAVSEDPDVARIWGVPVGIVGAASWMLGSAVACLAGILITPFINFDTVSLTILVLDALAAALIGGLTSLPLTVLGGFMLGLIERYSSAYIAPQSPTGFPKLVAIIVILAVLLIRRPAALQVRQA
jgi:branched-subunit amino acid ABC-type transport system permease component